MKDWKTTSAGVGAVLAVIASCLSKGSVSVGDIGVIFTGIVGIFAKDA